MNKIIKFSLILFLMYEISFSLCFIIQILKPSLKNYNLMMVNH